jgi:hypothetical protein
MPWRRQVKKGSFGGHFDDLVQHFPEHESRSSESQSHQRSRELQEKLDIHALLFERAWEIDRGGGNRSA